jgi:hypothetical protein
MLNINSIALFSLYLETLKSSINCNTSLFTDWINQAEMIIAENVDLVDVDRYVAAFVYLSYRRSSQPHNHFCLINPICK